MGTALFPVFEKKIEGFDPCVEVSGIALARHSEMIDTACRQLGVKTLWDFYDETPEEVENHLAEEITPELAEALHRNSLRWSDPSEAISVIQKVRAHLTQETDPTAIAVIKDLTALERALDRAVKEKTRFRLALDM
jgi:hypothetical protein